MGGVKYLWKDFNYPLVVDNKRHNIIKQYKSIITGTILNE